VQVLAKGKSNPMVMLVSDGNCAACHTAAGTNQAPGRVLAP
jgi:hypothetical protein